MITATAGFAQDHSQHERQQMDLSKAARQIQDVEDFNNACATASCGTVPIAPNSAEGSGTARLPGNEGGMHGFHFMPGDSWMLMAHGYAWGVYTNQSGRPVPLRQYKADKKLPRG